MSARWAELKKRGDWLIVEDKVPGEVTSVVGHWLKRNYSLHVRYSTFEVPEGTFVVLGYIPDGAVQAYEERLEQTRQSKIDAIHKARMEGKLSKYNQQAIQEAARKDEEVPDRPGEYFPTDEEIEAWNEEAEERAREVAEMEAELAEMERNGELKSD